ncbi:hypothetical protein DL237_01785 [Pseudooceanicola sediminis]|uniref:Uncharacterized protein n=1 Tax=Pseudooceanicola sediminis TaxID=2211117 RepID=A0A399J5W8_9RHOB|nr:hypothetical protein [Pseudooceanicola sediminis]KAA2316779.1 hypothetical protein E0K93_00135 [Puniceibacterium sp. HSS470]RII40764.1 hypothetical protein DL237_01785 [Pseudooceanicola sediminis]|tara:strand:+ start:247734 stop:248141 length:408 start_codon:yes stop_codon:yes gene_type:complete
MALNIEEEIDQRITAMEAEPQASSGVDQVRREILFINDVIHTTGAESRGSVRSLAQIEVYGLATPSSTVCRGIIRFRPPSELRPPYFKEADQTIRLWLDIGHLGHVTTQLLHRKRFLWIGIWPDGYTYADLHSRP